MKAFASSILLLIVMWTTTEAVFTRNYRFCRSPDCSENEAERNEICKTMPCKEPENFNYQTVLKESPERVVRTCYCCICFAT